MISVVLLVLIVLFAVIVFVGFHIQPGRLNETHFDRLPPVAASLNPTRHNSTMGLVAMPSVSHSQPITPIALLNSSNVSQDGRPNLHRFAYVTMLHGIDDSLAYRGFLYNALVAHHVLRKEGSKADFVVLVGFTTSSPPTASVIAQDLQLLADAGIKVRLLTRLRDPLTHRRVNFMEMALLKLTSWNLTQYERVQFMDADVVPRQNMDCWFSLNKNTFNTGSASPLNSGWYLAIPNQDDFNKMIDMAIQRMQRKWDEQVGWGLPINTAQLFYRHSTKPVEKWNFNGASLDQGLLTHHFALNAGNIQLLDARSAKCFEAHGRVVPCDMAAVLQVCGGTAPMDMFFHYTGRNKPWLRLNQEKKDRSLRFWIDNFDSMALKINSTSLAAMTNLKPPLGYFHPNQ